MTLTPSPISSPRRSARSAAFTLIELLTVIAIIGILAAILIPVVGAVRNKAKANQCASTMRQWGQAFMLYANENKGKYVICTSAGGNGGSWWYQIGSGNAIYAPYFSSTRTYDSMTNCPSEELNTGNNTIATTCYLMARPSSSTGPVAYNSLNLKAMSNPPRTLMMVERSFSGVGSGFNSGNGFYLHVDQSTATANADAFTRHDGKMNAVFADGHMEQLVANGTASNSWRGGVSGITNNVRWLTY